jgi:TonB family protein
MNPPHRKYEPLRMPRYPGGKKAFQKFISENVRYPGEAMKARIGGSVIVGYDINDNGEVLNAHIIRGLGYGCDEEALRVVGLLRYDKVKNRKVRVKMSTRTTIHFNLPVAAKAPVAQAEPDQPPTETPKVVFTIVPEKPVQPEKTDPKPKDPPATYSYTISF